MDVKLLSAPGTNLVSRPHFWLAVRKTYVDKDVRLSDSWTTIYNTLVSTRKHIELIGTN